MHTLVCGGYLGDSVCVQGELCECAGVYTDKHIEGGSFRQTGLSPLEMDHKQQLRTTSCPSELFLEGICLWGCECEGHDVFGQIAEIASRRIVWGEPEISSANFQVLFLVFH